MTCVLFHTRALSAVAGACATVGHDLFHTPFDVLKQRLQMSDYNPGSVNALRGLLGREVCSYRALTGLGLGVSWRWNPEVQFSEGARLS